MSSTHLDDRAAAEVTRALDDLHADGFITVTNWVDSYPGEPKLKPIFAEFDRRPLTVFLYPTQPARSGTLEGAAT